MSADASIDAGAARRTGLLLAAGGLLLAAVAAAVDLPRFLANWLVLFFFLLTCGMGALFLVALEYLVHSRWSVPFRRICEHLSAIAPVSLLFAVPVLLGLHHLYEWTHADVMAHDPVLASKTPYLNIPFFLLRLGVYAVVWLVFYRLFTGLSHRQDDTSDPALSRRGQRLAPPFMLLFAFTMTFAAIDLLMSLTPHWFSSMFGPCAAVDAIVAGLALTTLVAVELKRGGRLPQQVGGDHFYNLGGLLFAMNTLWAYMAFAEFLLIWYGNLPVELAWYQARAIHGWGWVGGFMLVGRFIIPFFALLSRAAKSNLDRLRWVSAWILLGHGLHLYWVVLPGVPHLEGGPFAPLDVAFPLLAAGVIMAVWQWRSRRGPLVPVGDPRLKSGLSFHL